MATETRVSNSLTEALESAAAATRISSSNVEILKANSAATTRVSGAVIEVLSRPLVPKRRMQSFAAGG